jgi:hypothetical protein
MSLNRSEVIRVRVVSQALLKSIAVCAVCRQIGPENVKQLHRERHVTAVGVHSPDKVGPFGNEMFLFGDLKVCPLQRAVGHCSRPFSPVPATVGESIGVVY